MKILQGWKTVPVKISCEGSSKKLIYPRGWTSENPADFDGNGLAVRTGEVSNLTVIDIDGLEALDALQKKFGIKLFNLCNYIIKTRRGWHFYFNYNPKLRTTSSFRGVKGVDIRNDGANVIIQAPANLSCASYRPLKESDTLTDVPEQLIFLPEDKQTSTSSSSSIVKGEVLLERAKHPLAKLVSDLLVAELGGDGRLVDLSDKAKSALRRLTPKIFRTGEMGEHYKGLYERQGYLAPNDIHDGDGSTYLSRVAAILAADETIDYDMYRRVLHHLNRLWSNPMPEDRLERTIIKDGEIIVDGKPIWKYNPKWEKDYEAQSKVGLLRKDGIIVFFEPHLEKYAIHNEHAGTLYTLSKQAFSQMMLSLTGEKFKAWAQLPVRVLTYNPLRLEREYVEDGIEYFNSFRLTPLLDLAQKGETPKKRPEFILKIIENLLPIPEKRELFLRWLGYWWRTRKKSQVSWVFISPQGAGKGLLTDLIIANVIGPKACSLEVGEDLLESQFTNWLKDKMFISFNEINTLTKDRYKNRNKIKRLITGDTFQLRQMGVGAYDYPNYANFIFSSNDAVPVDIEDTDRRFNVSIAIKPLRGQAWFDEVEDVRAKILEELPDFVRYVTSLEVDERTYNSVIDDEEKADIIADNRSPLEDFVVALATKDLEYFETELSGSGVPMAYLDQIREAFAAGYITTDLAFDLKNTLLPHVNISKTKLTRMLKRKGFEVKRKRLSGVVKRVYAWRE